VTGVILEEIEYKIAEVERSYQAQAGKASFCQLQKDGRVTGGVKYDEGWLVALFAARRALKDRLSLREDACQAAIAVELADWREALTAQQVKEPPPIPWIAYRQGGVDALAWVSEILSNQ